MTAYVWAINFLDMIDDIDATYIRTLYVRMYRFYSNIYSRYDVPRNVAVESLRTSQPLAHVHVLHHPLAKGTSFRALILSMH